MAFSKDYPAFPTVTTPPCIYLRNKAMYLRGTVGDTENYPEETNAPQCWCEQTQHHLGMAANNPGHPDDQVVERRLTVERDGAMHGVPGAVLDHPPRAELVHPETGEERDQPEAGDDDGGDAPEPTGVIFGGGLLDRLHR